MIDIKQTVQSCADELLPGFESYLTGYPTAGYYVFDRTWFADLSPYVSWTHSLLVPLAHLHKVSADSLQALFHLPDYPRDAELQALSLPITRIWARPRGSYGALRATRAIEQPLPVIVVADSSAQIEPEVLDLWQSLPALWRARFSFCTGPGANRVLSDGRPFDLQVVTRPAHATLPGQGAFVLDPRRILTDLKDF